MFGHGQIEGFARSTAWSSAARPSTSRSTSGSSGATSARSSLSPPPGDFAERATSCSTSSARPWRGGRNVFAYSNGTGPARSLVMYHDRYGGTSGWIRDSRPTQSRQTDGPKGLVRRTLTEGRGVADCSADDRGSRSASSAQASRPAVGAEVRERGLHVSLHAYGTRVFWDMREVSRHRRRLAQARRAVRRPGRAVAEGALRELQLAPVHDALRAAIAEPSRTSVERLVAGVADTTGTEGDQASVVDLVAARAAAAEPVIGSDRRPVPGVGDTPVDAARAARAAARRRRRRRDEPGVVRGAAAGAGRGRGAAGARPRRGGCLVARRTGSAAARPRAALDGRRRSAGRRLRLLDAWLADPVVRGCLRVNRWDEAEWFHRE